MPVLRKSKRLLDRKMPILRKSKRLLDRKISASKESPMFVEGSRPPKPSPRTGKESSTAETKAETKRGERCQANDLQSSLEPTTETKAETKRGERCQANDLQSSLEPTAERNNLGRNPEATRNSYMRIRAPDILRRFLTIDVKNEPLVHEARLGIAEGMYQEGDDMLARKLEEEDFQITDKMR